ncbi:MAG TPA: acetate--CoA ligase family protein [Acidimicrobiia bacterium]
MIDVDALRAAASPLPGTPERVVVPEPVVKAALRALGLTTPPSAAPEDASALRGPVVVKAWGPGIVHKTELGAVRLGLEPGGVDAVIGEIRDALDARGITPGGFLVEEQSRGGAELLMGVVRQEPFGAIAVLGLGGTQTELIGTTVARLAPISVGDARAMLDDLALGRREPVDRDAVVAALLGIAGADGLAARLGPAVVELECNPVAATGSVAVVLDARLILDAEDAVAEPPSSPADFAALFAPRAIAVAGASTTKVTFGNRFLAAYRDAGWTDGLFAVHPTADAIDGVPAVPSIAAVPGGVDYLLVAVPADRCAEVVRAAAGHASFVHVISGGFGETGAEGARLERELLDAARDARVRLLGPNCLGVFAPAGRQTFQLGAPRDAGTVAVVSQSGGLAGDIVKVGDRRGLRFSKVVTVGNAIDVMPGELLDHLVDDPATSVIGLYLEGARDGGRLVAALRRAAGRTPVVVLAAGASAQGERAVASHTGAMTGAREGWRAVRDSTGTAIVETLEDLLGVLAYLQRHVPIEPGTDAGVLVVGPGGGASVLATDACDRHGLDLTPVEPPVQDRLRALGYAAGTSVANPIEIPLGPATGPDAFASVLDPLLDTQPFADVLLHVNVQSYYGYGSGGVAPLLPLLERLGRATWRGARAGLVLRNLECAPAPDAVAIDAAVAAAMIPTFRTFDECAVAIAAARRFARHRMLLRPSP